MSFSADGLQATMRHSKKDARWTTVFRNFSFALWNGNRSCSLDYRRFRYLVGLGSAQTSVFSGIPWSTDSTLVASIRAAERSGLTVGSLNRLFDIDTMEDLQRAEEEGSFARPVFVASDGCQRH